ncbi:MAG TPA: glycogen synthase [Bacteroidetes bacterium]|nr:glycogen synthase [Bacteroidota bacterium]
MTVLHIAAEMAPLAKVGGLADVVGALPDALAAIGVQSSVLMPLYGGPAGEVAQRAGPLEESASGHVTYGGQTLGYTVFRATDAEGADVYLLHQPEHFGSGGAYFDVGNVPFANADDRFPAFQLCALDWLATALAGTDRQPDVLHLHDHHTGLIPALAAHDGRFAALRDTPTVFTIHSADHQGWAPWHVWEKTGASVPDAHTFQQNGDTLNAMRAALRFADRITTVSPTYAQELQASDEMAHGLADAFRQRAESFSGIVNGVDGADWDPSTDRHLPATYSADDLAGKAETKRAVCAELGLDPSRPLVTFVGRLTREKGAEILKGLVWRLLDETDAAFALLGSGAPEHEDGLRHLDHHAASTGRRDRLSVTLAFDNALAHRIYAAGDLFLMPSRSEPCGLGQLYAMAYGTPPVVHAVGGLRDTVIPWDGRGGTGFAFDAFTEDAAAHATRAALAVAADEASYRTLQQNAMAADHSWAASAERYAALYREAVR